MDVFDLIEEKVAELKAKYGDDVDLGEEVKAKLAELRAKLQERGSSAPADETPQTGG